MQLIAPSLHGQQLLLKRVVDLVGGVIHVDIGCPGDGDRRHRDQLDSRGPVFFGQERIGSGGRRFRCGEVSARCATASPTGAPRVGHQDVQGDDGQAAQVGQDGDQVYKLVNDERVTRVGRILRRASLDELPQLFNVIGG